MDYLFAVIAGAVQGLTEFLPISSTGHLIILEKLFKLNADSFGLAFDASLHLGTLLAVLIYFAKDYLNLLSFKNGLLAKLILATVPAVVIGLALESYIETSFRQLWVVGAALIVFSPVMVIAEKYGEKNEQTSQISTAQSLLIGFAQSLALIPGISRSGATISAGLFAGLKREEAAKFAFMLSGPIIAGAGLKKFASVISANSYHTHETNFFLIGMISSAIFGYLTIKYFIKYLQSQTLYPFVIYRLVLGTILLFL